MTIPTAANLLGVSRSTAYRAAMAGAYGPSIQNWRTGRAEVSLEAIKRLAGREFSEEEIVIAMKKRHHYVRRRTRRANARAKLDAK